MNKARKLIAAGVAASMTALAHAQTAPTTLDGFETVATGYIDKGENVAIAAAIVGFGWVGYKIVKKFTKGVAST